MNQNTTEAIPHNAAADSFDFHKSFEMVKQAIFCHKLLIASVMAGTLALVISYIVLWPANYEAKVVLIGDSKTDAQRGEFYKHWNMFRMNSLADEGELLTSNIIVGKVVDKLNLKYADVYHSFMNHLGYLWVESWIGRQYRKVKEWIFPKDMTYSLTPEELERGKSIISFKDGIAIESVPDTNIGVLIARGPSPRIADIANEMVDIYLEYRKVRMMEEADKAYDALKQEVDKAGKKLSEIESVLEKYYEENDMMLSFEKDKVQVGTWLSLKAAIVQLEAELSDKVASLEEVDRQLLIEDKDVVASRVLTKNSSRATLRSQIISLQISLEQAQIRYHDDAPEVVEIKEQIDALTKLWKEEEKIEQASANRVISETYQTLLSRKSALMSEIEGLRANLKVQKESEETTGEILRALPRKSNKTHSLEREHNLLETRYNSLSDKLTIATVSRATIASAPPALRIVDYAEYPEKPYWPKTKYLIVGAIVIGFLMGVMAAILVDTIYGRVSRYRLSTASGKSVYAIVAKDTKFAAKLFGLPYLKGRIQVR